MGSSNFCGQYNKNVLYCTNYIDLKSIEHNSILFSRYLHFKDLGYRFTIIGIGDSKKPGLNLSKLGESIFKCGISGKVANHKGMKIVFIRDYHLINGGIRRILANIDIYNVILIIGHDYSAAKYALSIASTFGCKAYYDSIETWLGVRNRKYKLLLSNIKKLRYNIVFHREKKYIKKFSRLLCHSYAQLDFFKKTYNLDERRIGVLFSALPIYNSNEKKDHTMSIKNIKKGGYRVIINSGIFKAKRGLEDLINCFAYVNKSYKLVLYGDGKFKKKIIKRINKKNLSKRIFIFPFSPVDEYYNNLKHADVGIDFRSSESLNYDLACSVRVIDYLNNKIPVITIETTAFKDMERRYGVVKYIPKDLPTYEKGAMIEKAVNYFLIRKKEIMKKIDEALRRDISYEANAKKLKRWLKEDKII